MNRSSLAHSRPDIESFPDAIHADGLGGTAVVHDRRRGRGAGVNPSGRVEPVAPPPLAHGWGSYDERPPQKTTRPAGEARFWTCSPRP